MNYQRNETPEPLASGVELKPCPHCGNTFGNAVFCLTQEHVAPQRVGWCVECGDCTASVTGFGTASEATDAWNRRATPALGAPGQEAAVSWQVRRTDGSPLACWETCTKDLYDLTLSTGRYCGFENGPPCEVRALGVIAAQEAAAAQAVGATPEQIEALAHRMAWRYQKSSDPHHSDTYTFNRTTLLAFAAALPPSGAGEKTS